MKKEFLDLGRQPIANAFLNKEETNITDEYFYDLKIGFDEETKLVSLVNFVDPPLMFNDSYVYHSSMSFTMRNHFEKASAHFKKMLNPKKILEIGSNDGVFIKHFDPKNTFAVEPCGNFAELTNKLGYKTYPNFWTNNLAEKIVDQNGKYDLVYSANCICHIQDLKDTFDAASTILSDDGVFVFEDPSLVSVVTKNCYDQFYDEHAHIFSVLALQNLLNQSGLEIFNVEEVSVHGVSNRIYAKKSKNSNKKIQKSVLEALEHEKHLGLDKFETFVGFADRVYKSKKDLVELLTSYKNENKKIISYGATCKSVTVFNFCEIGTDLIDYVTDTTPSRQNKLIPGSHIPVVSPEIGFDETVDVAFLGAWNFATEILNKESEYTKRGGVFVTHVPEVRVLK
tara:strand:- start:6685 stop:7875 length:1191 start_codon:yes stop_codon:yes gene_type:complete